MEKQKTISKQEAIEWVTSRHEDFKQCCERYGDDYSLEIALATLNKCQEEIEAPDVQGYLNPYLDMLWEELR
jgi:hypothetical protein